MNKKNLILVALAVVSFFSGAIDQYFQHGSILASEYLIETFVTFFLVYIWYRLDSDEYGYSRSRWLDIGVIALTVVVLPYYFFRSRGAKRGAIASGVMLLAYITSFALSIAGAFAIRYAVQR